MMLPPGAHIKLYKQCNILYHYEANTISVLHDLTNPSGDWKCFPTTPGPPGTSIHIVELGHLPVRPPGTSNQLTSLGDLYELVC